MTKSHCEIAVDELSQTQQLGSPRFFSISIVSNLSYSIQNIRNDPPKPKKDHVFINIHKLDKSSLNISNKIKPQLVIMKI